MEIKLIMCTYGDHDISQGVDESDSICWAGARAE